jgi:hypothetical protein
MQRTGLKRSAVVHTTFNTPLTDASHHGLAASRKTTPVALDATDDEVLLSPAGTLQRNGAVSDGIGDRGRRLIVAIRQRIESRLGDRVRDLAVLVMGRKVILEGRCATYYTKQLAQHAALGVLEDELLENNIVVSVPR